MFPNVGKRASSTTVEGVTAPITNMGTQLRDLSKQKYAEVSRLEQQRADLQQQIITALDEADRALRIAEQLEGLVL